jgi:hypothetical protein
VTGRRTIAILLLVAAVMMLVLARATHPRGAEEEEEKPITSSVARVSRDAAGHVLIAIGQAAQKEIGITTEILKPIVRPVEVEAYGFVLDPAPLSKLIADLTSAHAALNASSAQYRRTRRLYAEQKNASLRDLQSAEATYLNDQARVEALEQQLRDAWGREIAQMAFRARAELVSALIDRRQAIARVTVPVGEVFGDSPRRAEVFVLGQEQQALNARAVFDAAKIDPRMQGQTFMLLVDTNAFPVRPGTAVSARLPVSDKDARGVMVPRSAVVRYAGKEWVYRQLDADHFVRLELVPTESTVETYFVTEHLEPGMRIVITGAQMLLSEERKAEIQIVQ